MCVVAIGKVILIGGALNLNTADVARMGHKYRI